MEYISTTDPLLSDVVLFRIFFPSFSFRADYIYGGMRAVRIVERNSFVTFSRNTNPIGEEFK